VNICSIQTYNQLIAALPRNWRRQAEKRRRYGWILFSCHIIKIQIGCKELANIPVSFEDKNVDSCAIEVAK
jgi:hypothetical protein